MIQHLPTHCARLPDPKWFSQYVLCMIVTVTSSTLKCGHRELYDSAHYILQTLLSHVAKSCPLKASCCKTVPPALTATPPSLASATLITTTTTCSPALPRPHSPRPASPYDSGTTTTNHITTLTEWPSNRFQSKQRKSKNVQARCRARALHINQETENHAFDAPLPSYKRKDNLIALAGALSLSMDVTVTELIKAIRDHVADNPT